MEQSVYVCGTIRPFDLEHLTELVLYQHEKVEVLQKPLKAFVLVQMIRTNEKAEDQNSLKCVA